MDVERLTLPNGKMIPASKFGGDQDADQGALQLSAEEQEVQTKAKQIWNGILNVEIMDETDFFGCGAGSMDVVRLAAIDSPATGCNRETYLLICICICSQTSGGDEAEVRSADNE